MIASLHIYPIKSLPGLRVDHVLLTPRGPQHDRRYMLVDKAGCFITQRHWPQMALFKLQRENNDTLVIQHGTSSLSLPFIPEGGSPVNVEVWDDRCEAMVISNEANTFFSDSLGMQCRLVYMPDSTQRATDTRYASGHITSFSDGYPYLITGTASFNDLSDKMGAHVDSRRFRPNIILQTERPFEEDEWIKKEIQDNQFALVKPCSRCILINVDPDTGEVGKEPLRTLSGYRHLGHKVWFGQNAVWLGGSGVLRVSAKS
jgi:uncharacterized protein